MRLWQVVIVWIGFQLLMVGVTESSIAWLMDHHDYRCACGRMPTGAIAHVLMVAFPLVFFTPEQDWITQYCAPQCTNMERR